MISFPNILPRFAPYSKILLTLLSVYCLLITGYTFSQGTAINTTGAPADNSAMLDISSTTKGTLITRMTTTERNAIVSPASGLQIYNLTTKCFEFFENGGWYSMACVCTQPNIPVASAASGAGNFQFTANWTSAFGATGYKIDVASDATFSSILPAYYDLNVSNVLSYNISGLSCNTTYYYRIRAYNNCGTSGNSNTVSQITSSCFSCGSSFIDARDGNSYTTILVGSQCWMSQNLNYGTYVNVHTGAQAFGTKYCRNHAGNNDNSCPMGGLYEWAVAMNGASSCNGTGASQVRCPTLVQGVCPDGWHIPSHYEWTRFERVIGGSDSSSFPYDNSTAGMLGSANEGGNMKITPVCGSAPCWNSPNAGATNSTGFNGIPGGWSGNGAFVDVGILGYWWTTLEYNSTFSWCRSLRNDGAASERTSYSKADGFSIRCVKD